MFEEARPLSESVIWRVQDRYYDELGGEAWASGEVPHSLTSGPMLARAYARLVEAFVADCRDGALGPIDVGEPIYLLELGSGTGRLAHEFFLALDHGAIEPLRLVYVLTDRVESNVTAFGEHPMLAPLLAAGVLDYAHLVAGSEGPIELLHSHEVLKVPLVNPLVLIANYLFDVIPQDLFTTESGELFEELVTTCTEDPDLEEGSREFFRRIFLATTRRSVAPDRYGGGPLDRLLAATAAAQPEGRFLFPADAVRALQMALHLADGRLLSLIGERPGRVPRRDPDAGEVAAAIRSDLQVRQGPAVVSSAGLEALRPGALLSMGIHGGSMSLPVDLSILAASAPGPLSVLLPESPPSALLVAAMVMGEGAPALATRRAYRRFVAETGPEDLYLLVKAALGEGAPQLGHAEHLAVLRAGGYDPYLLRLSFDAFERRFGTLDEAELEELARVLDRTYEHDFPIEDTDVAYGIAAVLAPSGAYEEALSYFERSAARSGARASISYNAALCLLHLGRVEDALAALREAIGLDAEYEAASKLLAQVLEEQARDAARLVGG